MARKHLSHIKSKLTEGGGPKLPTPSQLIEGEIAVNFAKGYETLSILNSNSGITTFSNDTTIMSYVDGQDMEIANAAGISAVTTSQGVTDYQYVANQNNPILSGATSLKNADELLSQTILDNEVVIAAALNDLEDRKLDASAYTPTDLSNYYNKQEIDTALSEKQDTLISGTNIKTVNGESLLGSGDIDADDVIMGKLDGINFYKVTGYTSHSNPQFSSTPETGAPEKIYVDILTNKAYRWNKGPTQIGESRYKLLGEELSIITDGEINALVPAETKKAVSAKVLRDNFYTETEVDDALSRKQDTLSAGTGIDITNNVVSCTLEMTEFVSELPLSGETGKIYFVPNAESEEQGNVFTEYAWTTGNTWEKIGEWKADMTIDQELDSGSTNPVANSAITFELSEIEEAVGASLWDLNAKIVDNRHDIEMLIDDVLVNAEVLAASGTSTFAQANKRYNVDGELELESGATYNVGSGSTIHFFNSGKLSGEAILAVNNTNIDAPMKQIFDENIELGGLLKNSEIYPEWWGAAGDGVTDDADAINRCIKMACHTPVVLTAENYLVGSTIGCEESITNSAANAAAHQSSVNYQYSSQLIIKHNIIGDANLAGPVVRFAVSHGLCKVCGSIIVRNSSDDCVGFTSFPSVGGEFGASNSEIYINTIFKGDWANHYYNNATYQTTYGIGNGVGAVLYQFNGQITIDYIGGFKHGVYMSRIINSIIHIGSCESTYCFYLGTPKPAWHNVNYNWYVTRNKVFLGKQVISNNGTFIDFITGTTDSAIIKEDGNQEISLNEFTIGDSDNIKSNSRHPHRHSLLYTAGSAGHTGNKYNFNITYAVESTTSPARKFVKFVYASNPAAANGGQACGDVINFGVGCYLKDIDIPYGWNVQLNNVLISNEDKSTGTFRWFGGFLLLDTVTVSRITSPIHSSGASTINILSVNPQCKGMIVATDTVPSTCENNKLYVVDTPVTSGGTAKYPVYCKYFGTDATLVGYSLDNYKEGQSLSAGTGIQISGNVISSLVTPYVETTYSELKDLRDGGYLTPGTWYRITDYQCTTTQENTSAATHQFDILVLATNEETLSELARAAKHTGGTYFYDSKLDAWQLWYCIDNDTSRFAWADATNGKGVIYRMIDEFGNDITYDFKNIMFRRTITNGSYATGGTNTWCYTLNVWHNNSCNDASVIGNTLINDEDYVVGVYKNKFGTCTEFDVYGDTGNTLKFRLGDNVVLTVDYGNEYYGCYSNTIGNTFYSNTIGDDFSNNTIGNSFVSNTIGNSFGDNTIGNSFVSNTIGNSFDDNTIGNGFDNNTIGNGFSHNTIDNQFRYNTIDDYFRYNTIGNSFYYNTIGNQFCFNTIGNQFYFNTIGTGTGSTATTIDYVRFIRVEDGIQYVNITTTATTSSSAYLQNITISQGIVGTSSSRKTITHPTVNDTFQTIYRPANSQVISV